MIASRERGPFGDLLHHYRSRSGLTQEELAERAGISPRSVGGLERSAQLRPYPSTVRRLAEALDLSRNDQARLLNVAAAWRKDNSSARVAVNGAMLAHRIPLVGRKREQEILRHHLLGDGPPILLFAGEPGIGKTRLLQEAAGQARGLGMTILIGECERQSGQDPYSPVTQALQRRISDQATHDLVSTLAGAEWLVRLLPEVRGVVEGPHLMGSLAPEQKRRLIFEAVTRFLANCATPSGLLLILDDLQWCGSEALHLLLYLLRRRLATPVRVVGAYRTTDFAPDSHLGTMLGDFARDRLLTRVTVGELSPDAAAELLRNLVQGEEMKAESAAHIIARSDGVPFFLVSYADGLRSGAYAEPDPANPPWTLVEGVQQRINALPPSARKALTAAAIFGRQMSPSLLAPVVDSSEEQVLDALGFAWRAGIIKQSDEGGYRFSHDVIREVVEAAIEPPRRTLLHRRVAETLEKLPVHRRERAPAVLAWHFGQGGEPARALEYSMQAGNTAQATFANAAAAEHFDMAAELAAALADRKRHAEALEKQGTALRVLGKYHAALNRLDAALEAYGPGRDDHGRGRVVGQIARVHWYQGSFRDGIERIDRFLASMDGATNPPLLADLYAIRAGLLEASGRYEEGLSAADYAADLIRKEAEPPASSRDLAAIEVRRGALLLALGRQKEGAEVAEAALSLAQGAGDPRLAGSILDRLSASHDNPGGAVDLEQAIARRQQALVVLERVGNPSDTAVSLSSLATYQARLGCWDEARSAIEQAVALARSTEPTWVTAGVHLTAGWMYLHAGIWAQARHNLQECVELGERVKRGENGTEPLDVQGEDLNRLLYGQAGLALLETFEGAPEEARKRCQALLAGIASHAPPASLLLCILALARAKLGDIAEARGIAAEAVERAAHQGGKSWRVLPGWVRGIALAQGGRCDEALEVLKDALAMARDRCLLWEEAVILESLGDTMLGIGDAGTARARLQEALAIFHKFGGGGHAERVEHRLAQHVDETAHPLE